MSASLNWLDVRAQFPAIGRTVYLNTAGGGPLPVPVGAAGAAFYEEMRDIGDSMWPVWLDRLEHVRSIAAAYLNASADTIAFAPHTSYAMNVAGGYLRDVGISRVVTPTAGFPAIPVSLAQQGLEVVSVPVGPDGAVSFEDVRAALGDAGTALAVSAVDYGTGYRYDLSALRDLCREAAAPFLVDASQSLGAFPLDIAALDPDFVAASTYKWLLGGYGCSVTFVAPRWTERRPPVAGWASVGDDGELRRSAAVLELGCPAFSSIFAAGAGMQFLTALGEAEVEGRVLHLTAYLHEALSAAGLPIASTTAPMHRSGITLVRVPDPTAVAAALKERDVFVSAKGLGLRVSVFIYNTEEDIDRFVHELRTLV